MSLYDLMLNMIGGGMGRNVTRRTGWKWGGGLYMHFVHILRKCVGVVYARLLGLWWFFFCIEWQRLMEWLCDSLRFVFNLIYWVVCAPRQLFCSIWSLSYLSRFLLLLFLMMVVCVFWCGSCSLARLGWVLSVLQAANCVHIGRPLHFWIFRCVSSASINRSVTNPLVVALPLVPFCVA